MNQISNDLIIITEDNNKMLEDTFWISILKKFKKALQLFGNRTGYLDHVPPSNDLANIDVFPNKVIYPSTTILVPFFHLNF